MDPGPGDASTLALRTTPRPSDFQTVVDFHRREYERAFGFDAAFAAHVAGPLRAFLDAPMERERIWFAERDEAILGCVAIVEAGRNETPDATDADAAQLRWFLVAREVRGAGLGARLLREATEFSRAAGYPRIVLWTVDVLAAAARIYGAAGFVKVESNPVRLWGVDLSEEKYELRFGEGD